MSPQKLILPWPPSLNRYYRTVKGRIVIAAAGRKYRHLVSQIGLWQKIQPLPPESRLAMRIITRAPTARAYDLDNYLKCLLDSLHHAGYIQDDKYIDDLHLIRGPKVRCGEVELVISVIDP